MTAAAAAENPGYTVVTDLKTAGAIIWWRLSGDTDLEALKQSWLAMGLDEKLLPDNPSKTVALSRAAADQGTARRLIRPLPGGKGWAIVDETPDRVNGRLTYSTLADLRLQGGELVVVNGNYDDSQKLTDKEVAQVRAAFEGYQRRLTISDVSSWLSHLVAGELKTVSLRDTGGVYFVPADKVDTYRAIVKALCGASRHRMFEVPALKSDEAVDAILDAVLREADGQCEAMETELDTKDFGKRALQARQRSCEKLRLKVEAYEALLGRSMGQVRERIENLKASVVAAELTVDAEEAA